MLTPLMTTNLHDKPTASVDELRAKLMAAKPVIEALTLDYNQAAEVAWAKLDTLGKAQHEADAISGQLAAAMTAEVADRLGVKLGDMVTGLCGVEGCGQTHEGRFAGVAIDEDFNLYGVGLSAPDGMVLMVTVESAKAKAAEGAQA